MWKANVRTNWIAGGGYQTQRTGFCHNYFFENFISAWEPLVDNWFKQHTWFNVPTTQILIFIISASASVLFARKKMHLPPVKILL